MFVHTALFLFLPCLFQKCRFISSPVRAHGEVPRGLGWCLPCTVGGDLSSLRRLGWEQCSHGLTSRPLESCHHQCVQAVCEFGRVSRATFSGLFPPSKIPRLGGILPGGAQGEESGRAAADHLDESCIPVKRVRLTRKRGPGYPVHVMPDPGLPTPGRHGVVWLLLFAWWRTWWWECRLLQVPLTPKQAEQVRLVLRLWTSL